MNVKFTVELVDEDFEGNHLEILEGSLAKFPRQQLTYLTEILETKMNKPASEQEQGLLLNRNQYFKKYVTLVCNLEP